ncbi:uncharacterized protein LOC134263231 [Saccostrea cucullata]|uniref:uncharacterized protein LOC134263231 n=1 Tax=Saccostrea cuccullata TaxID=36930 RepID=UPI002ED28FD0
MKCVSPQYQEYISGSLSEGFQFYWIDLDVMSSPLVVNVVLEVEDVINPQCEFIAIDSGCQPGFSKLLPLYSFVNRDATCLNLDTLCLSRISFLQEKLKYILNKNCDSKSHGPCISTNFPKGYDICYGIPIDPDSSNKFLKNFTTNFWDTVKSDILKQKEIPIMHFVPKGPMEGDNSGIQWLKSFSVLEKYIVRSLNHVQFCCYGLLKIVIHFEIEECLETQDTLCSYHLKTVLFHVLEDIHVNFWIPSNIIWCFRICLIRLLLYVQKGVCPNYFIPDCNLFLKEGFMEKKYKIEGRLLRVLQYRPDDLLRFLQPLSFRNLVCLIPNASRKLKKLMTISFALLCVKGHHTTYNECMLSIFNIINAFEKEEKYLMKTVLIYLFSIVMRRAGVILYEKFILTGFREYLFSSEAALSLARYSNASGALYLATLYYCERKFKHAIHVISGVLTKLPDSILFCISYNNALLKDIANSSFTDLLRNYNSHSVYLDRNSCFRPQLLENEVNGCIIGEYVMYDKSYAYFLKFLCYLEFKNKRKCTKTLSKLYKSYTDIRFIVYDSQTKRNSRTLGIIAKSRMKLLN